MVIKSLVIGNLSYLSISIFHIRLQTSDLILPTVIPAKNSISQSHSCESRNPLVTRNPLRKQESHSIILPLNHHHRIRHLLHVGQ